MNKSLQRNQQSTREILTFLAILTPSIIFLAIFFLYPIFLAFKYSFTNLSLYSLGSYTYVGLSNYVSLFTSGIFVHSVMVTLAFLIVSAIIGQMFLGMVISYLFSMTGRRFRTIITTILLMAWATPKITAAIMWYSTASYLPPGTLDTILIGLGGHPVNFLSRNYALLTVIAANIWIGLGFSVLIFSAGIENINPSIMKASIVDGASSMSRFFRIVVPSLKNSILMDLILITLFTLGAFTIVFGITGSGPANSTNILTVYQYYTAFSFFDIGLSNAIGVVIILIAIILSIIYIKIIDVRSL